MASRFKAVSPLLLRLPASLGSLLNIFVAVPAFCRTGVKTQNQKLWLEVLQLICLRKTESWLWTRDFI